jgi:malonyl-CoA O-methyltransferase
MSTLIVSKPQKAFSQAACRYDRFSALQKEIGLGLMHKIPDKQYQHILDIGMGTGWLTEKCGQRFPKAKTTGLDYAPGMVECAKKRDIDCVLEADARELPFKEGAFDLVISNCVYQWIEDLPKAFGESARVLNKEGDFFFTCFGPATLKELREAIHQSAPDAQTTLHHWHLLDKENIYKVLEKAGFQNIVISSDIKKETFNDFLSLIHWLKAIGANRARRHMFIGRQLLAQANAYYQKHFSVRDGVMASFEIISGVAKK